MKKNPENSGTDSCVMHVVSGDLWGGAEALVLELVREQQQRSPGHITCVVMNPGILATELAKLGVPLVVLDESRQGLRELVLATAAAIRNFSPRIIHAHRQKENLVASLARLLSHSRHRLVTTVHGMPEPIKGGTLLRRKLVTTVNQWTLRLCFDAIVAVSHDMAATLQPCYPNNRILCIYNGIRVPAIAAAPARTDHSTRPLRLLALGRLVSIKRFERLGALSDAIMNRTGERPQITLAGDGPLAASLRESLRADEPSRLIRMPGFIAKVEPLLQDCDALVITSDHEGIPMAALEALARGIPVFSFAVGGLPEISSVSSSLFLAPPGNSIALADVIIDHFRLHSPAVRQAPPADWQFDIRQCALAYDRLYDSL